MGVTTGVSVRVDRRAPTGATTGKVSLSLASFSLLSSIYIYSLIERERERISEGDNEERKSM